MFFKLFSCFFLIFMSLLFEYFLSHLLYEIAPIGYNLKHSKKFMQIFLWLSTNSSECFSYSHVDNSSWCSLFKSTIIINCCSIVEDDHSRLFKKCTMLFCPYFLYRTSNSIEEENMVIFTFYRK